MSLPRIITGKVEECLETASRLYSQSFQYESIRFDLKGRVAGQVVYDPKVPHPYFRFNTDIASRYQDAFIREVVPHECAHLIAFQVFGRRIRPHGREWKEVMESVFGLEAKVRHNFETAPARATKQFDYECGCPDYVHSLSTIRHNKVARGKARYLCKNCSSVLSFVG